MRESRPIAPWSTVPQAARRALSHRELLYNLVRRDLRSRYRWSVLGWVWSLLNPAATALIYAFVFTKILPITPRPGVVSGQTSFVVFLLSGILPWNSFVNGVNSGMSSLIGAAGIIKKVPFPREHLVVAPVLAMGVSFFIEISVLVAFIVAIGGLAISLIPYLVVLVLLLTVFVVGVALLFATLNVRLRDVQYLVGILFMVWFYLTPIIYEVSRIPERLDLWGHSLPLRSIMLLNPMSRFVQAFRNCLYDGLAPGPESILGLAVISVATTVLGYCFFARRAPWLAEEL